MPDSNSSSGALALLCLSCALSCNTRHSPAAPPDETHPEWDVAVEKAVAGIQASDIARRVETLASDTFEGRFPGSAGEVHTVGYVAAEFARVGVAPLGRQYTQPVPLVSTTVDPTSTISIDGSGAPLQWGEEFLASPRPDLASVELEGVGVVFAGFGIEAPEYGWDDYAGVDARGKIVIVLGGEPAPSPDAPDRFEGRALSWYGTHAAKKETAAAHGAIGVFSLRADGAYGVAWKTLAIGAAAPKMGLDEPSSGLKIAGLIRRDRAAGLLGETGGSWDALEDAARQPGYRAKVLSATVSVSIRAGASRFASQNVVAAIEGAQRPDEYIIYTAHWDHVGVRPGLKGDRIFNGAVDNATGTAALLELAEAYASLPSPPNRSVIFLATTAEEQGLLGSRWFAAHPMVPLRDTVAVINMDALFPFGRTHGMTVVAKGSTELEDYFAVAARTVDRELFADTAPEAGAFFRSDHYPFAERGVPAIFAVGGPSQRPEHNPKRLEPLYIDYITNKYHQPADEYDPQTWDLGGIVQDVTIYFRAGLAIAQDDRFPNWTPGHKFRPRRDAMRAETSSL